MNLAYPQIQDALSELIGTDEGLLFFPRIQFFVFYSFLSESIILAPGSPDFKILKADRLGIVGKEGKQASLASDFSINEF